MFDARAAKALQPGDHLTVPEAPGLRLQATASTRTWCYRFKSPVDGRMRQVRLGHWPAMGFAAAIAAWETQRTARAAGVDPAQQRRQRRAEAAARSSADAFTVRVACTEFLADYKGAVAAKTYREAERLLLRELATIERRPAAQITRADAFDLIHAMRDRPVVAAALRRLLGAVWDRALDAGRLAPDVPNWWRLVLRGKLPSQGKVVSGKRAGVKKRVLSEAELAQLLPWLPNFTRDIDDVCTLYLWTACRGSEIVAIERSELAAEADGLLWWTIPREKLKMRRNPLTTDLRVPLIGRAAAVVRRRLAANSERYLFASHGASGHIEQKAVGVAVWTHMPGCALRPEWVRPRLPVQQWAPHDLRRTSRTLLAALGCPDEIGEAVLGHLPEGIVGTYNLHRYDSERVVWLKKLAARLEALCGGRARAAGR